MVPLLILFATCLLMAQDGIRRRFAWARAGQGEGTWTWGLVAFVLGAAAARRVGEATVRRLIVIIGFGMAASLMLRS